MHDRELELYSQSLEIAKDLGGQFGIGQTLNNIAAAHHNKGEYENALYYARQSYEILKRLDIPELQRSLDIISSVRETIGAKDFEMLEYKVKRKINDLR
jgi:hypothetical protein